MANANESDPAVLVVGAGPVGLALACELARHGVPFRIVDAGDGPTDQSRALGIQARTMEVFENLGVVEAVLSRGRKLHGMQLWADARRLTHIRFDFSGVETSYPFVVILPQSETERILIDRLRALGAEVDRRTTLTGLRQDGSVVTATLVDADGRSTEARARWLVGCDGARSAVRKGLGLPFEGGEYEEWFLLADVRLDWDRPDDEIVNVLTPGGPIVAFPLPEPGRWRLVESTGRAAPDADPSRVVAHFQSRLRDHGRADATVSDPTWTSAFRIHHRVAARFREGRCFIAGDAAHIHSPAGGQGMNTGIQDAFNLAWKLALVDRGASTDSLLNSYTPERRSAASGVVKGTHLATKLITLRNPVARAARNGLIGLIGRSGFVVRKLTRTLSELEVAYPDSPIVAEDGHFRGGPRPGSRVPDVSAGPDRPFDALRGTKHALLLFDGGRPGADPAPIREAIGRHADEITIRRIVRGEGPGLQDPDGALHRRFGLDGPGLYLLRPDGYVGYRASPPDPAKLSVYLRRVFA